MNRSRADVQRRPGEMPLLASDHRSPDVGTNPCLDPSYIRYANAANQRLLAMSAANMSVDSAKSALETRQQYPHANPVSSAPRQLRSRPISQEFPEIPPIQEKPRHGENNPGLSSLQIEEKYLILVSQVGVLSKEDDGIKTNKKLQRIEEILCSILTVKPHASQLSFSLRGILNAIAISAITDSVMTPKIGVLISSVWFTRAIIFEQKLYNVFMEIMHEKIDFLEQSENRDKYFVNTSLLLTDVFTDSKMLSPEELSTLAKLIIRVMNGLLSANTKHSLKQLNVQLMQHGRKLLKFIPEQLEELSLKSRQILLSRTNLSSSCVPWLLLLSDTCLYRFDVLPTYLQQFYSKVLEDSMQDVEPPEVKDIEPHIRKLSINQERKVIKSDSSDRWSIQSNGDGESLKYAASVQDDVFDDEHSEYSAMNGRGNERKMRPILGAGAKATPEFDPAKIDFSVPPPPLPSEFDPPHVKMPQENNPTPIVKHPTSINQDNDDDYWGKPKQTIQRSNQSSLSSRLDLNSWRLANADTQPEIEAPTKNQIDLSVNVIQQQKEAIEDWINETPTNSWSKEKGGKVWEEEPPTNLDDENPFTGTSHWGKSKSVDIEEKETKPKIVRQPGDWRSPEARLSQEKKELSRRNSDEKDSNWRKPQPETREGERKPGQWGIRKHDSTSSIRSLSEDSNKDEKRGIRRDRDAPKEGKNNGKPKRDALEVPRKASYWSHDDRCDKDY